MKQCGDFICISGVCIPSLFVWFSQEQIPVLASAVREGNDRYRPFPSLLQFPKNVGDFSRKKSYSNSESLFFEKNITRIPNLCSTLDRMQMTATPAVRYPARQKLTSFLLVDRGKRSERVAVWEIEIYHQVSITCSLVHAKFPFAAFQKASLGAFD